MPDKSHVSMEQKQCPICGIIHTFECGILLDRRMKDSLERYTVTGQGLCEEHDRLHKDGFVALIVIDETKSRLDKQTPLEEVETQLDNNIRKLSKKEAENVARTGEIIHLRGSVYRDLFNLPGGEVPMMVFIDTKLSEMIKKMAQNITEESDVSNT